MVLVPTGERPFEEIARNFTGELPESGAFNTILVVIAQFSKVQHYIVAQTTRTAEDNADS